MEGYLGKKGKRMGSRVKRFMRLEGAVLSNHQDEDSLPSWRINLKDAAIACNAKRSKIAIEVYNNKLELYADTSRECLEWYDALRNAKRKANAHESGEKENVHDSENHGPLTAYVSSTSESLEDREEKARAQLGRNFKVVKPASRNSNVLDFSDSSDHMDDDNRDEKQMPGQLHAYEETPASMIFKQFTFPTKNVKSQQ